MTASTARAATATVVIQIAVLRADDPGHRRLAAVQADAIRALVRPAASATGPGRPQ